MDGDFVGLCWGFLGILIGGGLLVCAKILATELGSGHSFFV